MKYLIPFDFTDASKNALTYAKGLADISGGDLFLLHIVEEVSSLKQKEVLLKQFVKDLNYGDKIPVSSSVVVGEIFTDIGKIATYHGADLVVMGTHGVDTMQKIFGSNSVKIIKNATVPFIVVQETSKNNQIKKIVMPFSIESKSIQVLRFATQLSKIYGTEIHLLGRKHDDEFLKHKENTNVILSKTHLLDNDVKHVIEIVDVAKSKFQEHVLEYANKINADLIATTYYNDSLMPMFEKFVQNLIVNESRIPVLCLNSQSLTKVDSTLSFMTV